MTTKSSSFIIASLCLLVQLSAQAGVSGVYKWVDENGQVQYGDQPVNSDAEKVTIRQNETTKPRPVKNTDEGKNMAETAKKEPELVEAPVPKKEKIKLCNEAKSDIASINSRGRMREINSKGEYNYLTEEQRQQRLAAATKKQREYCR